MEPLCPDELPICQYADFQGVERTPCLLKAPHQRLPLFRAAVALLGQRHPDDGHEAAVGEQQADEQHVDINAAELPVRPVHHEAGLRVQAAHADDQPCDAHAEAVNPLHLEEADELLVDALQLEVLALEDGTGLRPALVQAHRAAADDAVDYQQEIFQHVLAPTWEKLLNFV